MCLRDENQWLNLDEKKIMSKAKSVKVEVKVFTGLEAASQHQLCDREELLLHYI